MDKKLPSMKSKDVIKILEHLGFYKFRQKGSHIIMVNNTVKNYQPVIPIHNKELKKGRHIGDGSLFPESLAIFSLFYFPRSLSEVARLQQLRCKHCLPADVQLCAGWRAGTSKN